MTLNNVINAYKYCRQKSVNNIKYKEIVLKKGEKGEVL